MAWGKNGTPDTLTTAGSNMNISDLGSSKTNVVLSHTKRASGNTYSTWYLNNENSSSSYSSRQQENGGTDGTRTSANTVFYDMGGDDADKFSITYIFGISSAEKLAIGFGINSGPSAGSSGIPERGEFVWKWENTSSTIDRIDNQSGEGTYDTDSNLTALGSDITPASAVPAISNVQDNSLFVEKDTAIRYWFTAGGEAPTTTSHFEGHGQQPVDVSDTIDIPTTGLSNLSTGSVSFWIYLETESTSAGDYVVISASNDTQASREFALGFVGHVTGVGIIARNNGSGICTFTCPNSLTRNAWNHVVYTNNSSGNKVYVNGSQVTPSYSVGSASTNAFFGTVGTNNTCTIGANKDNDSGGYYQWGFDGNLQQLLVYSAVLTQAEITALYNNGKYSEPSTTNLLRRYELTSNANDTSGNGHNGTATAGVTYTSLAVPPTPATWTMNPTIEDDLTTNNGWVFPTNSSYDSTNDQIDLTIASSSFDVSYIDLQKAVYFGSGNNLDDDKFIIRARITKNNNLSDTSKGSSLLLQVSSALTDSSKTPNPQDAVGIRIDTNRTGGSSTNKFFVHSTDNGTFWAGESSGISYDWGTGDLYWEIIGDGTNVTGELFTGSDYSTGSLGKATTSQQSPTGMRYLKFCGFNDPSRTATQFSLQDFIIYNGATTPN